MTHENLITYKRGQANFIMASLLYSFDFHFYVHSFLKAKLKKPATSSPAKSITKKNDVEYNQKMCDDVNLSNFDT